MRSLAGVAAILASLAALHPVVGARPGARGSSQAPSRAVSVEVIDGLSGPVTEVASMNNNGVIVGTMGSPFRWTPQDGVEVILPGVPGRAADVNERGDIVGTYQVPHLDEITNGFLWTPKDGFTDLGTFLPAAINNRGDIAGSCGDEARTWWHPCLWQNGTVTKIGEEWLYGAAGDINEREEVVGQLLVYPFTWSAAGGTVMLPTEAGGRDVTAFARAVNNRGEVVGFRYDHQNTVPIRWSPRGEATVTEGLGRHATFNAINASGWVAGQYTVEVGPNWYDLEAFLLSPRGEMTVLGRGYPVAITDGGSVLGIAGGVDRQTVVWRRR